LSDLAKKHTIILTIVSVIAIVAFAGIHLSCHSGDYSSCLLIVCAFVLTAVSVSFMLGSNPLFVFVPANRSVSIPIRLDRPPRS